MNQGLILDLDFKVPISGLLKQTRRPEWHLQAFIEHCDYVGPEPETY